LVSYRATNFFMSTSLSAMKLVYILALNSVYFFLGNSDGATKAKYTNLPIGAETPDTSFRYFPAIGHFSDGITV